MPDLPVQQEVARQEIKDLFTPSFGLLTTNPLGLTSVGQRCYDLMGLRDLPVDDYEKVFALKQ